MATRARGRVPLAEGAARLTANQEEGGGASLNKESAGFYCEGHLGEVRVSDKRLKAKDGS